MEPFWGINPIDLNGLQAGHEPYRDSYTIGKAEDSNIALVTSSLPDGDPDSPTKFHSDKAKQIFDMLNQFSKFIPPFHAVFFAA